MLLFSLSGAETVVVLRFVLLFKRRTLYSASFSFTFSLLYRAFLGDTAARERDFVPRLVFLFPLPFLRAHCVSAVYTPQAVLAQHSPYVLS
jgi:hypothetical protein